MIAEVRRLEPMLVGQDPRNVERLWQVMYDGGLGYKGGPVKMSALSGIDIALWDIAGKAAGQPIHRLLGGACRDRVRMYRSAAGHLPYCVQPGQAYREGRTTQPDMDDPAIWRAGARILTQEWGFRCLKVHFGPGSGLEVTSHLDRFVERFAAVREGAGPGIDIASKSH